MSSTFRILFLLRKTKLNKNGLGPIVIRVTINGKVVEFSSKLFINPDLWDPKAGRAKGKSKVAKEVNDTLKVIWTRLYEDHRTLIEMSGYVTPQGLRDYFLGPKESRYTLLDLFDKKIKQKYKLVNISIEQETLDKYICTRNRIKSFIKEFYNKEDISMNNVNYDFVINFKTHLISEYKHHPNTVVRYLRYLKQITTESLKNRYIFDDPFYDIKLSSKRGVREYLSLPELVQITKANLNSCKLNDIKNIFIFSCFTGLPYKELYNLEYSDIQTNENGDKYIYKKRIKTGEKFYVPLLEIPLLIIERYKEYKKPKNKVFPIPPCYSINRLLKEITACCNIKKNITTHCGRHTFATLMLTKGVPIESISKMLGHTDISTTQIYTRILNNKVDEDMRKVQNMFDEIKKHFEN